MIPSPDWFIGASGLDLCSDGHWLESKQFDLDPMDAGSDRGLTFTSPNWAELKPKPISKITCKFPNHSASSFYYPELETLPPVAVLKLTKVSLPWNDTSDFDIKNMPTSYEVYLILFCENLCAVRRLFNVIHLFQLWCAIHLANFIAIMMWGYCSNE